MKNWVFLLLILLTGCTLFSEQEEKLAEYSWQNVKATIYLVSTGATTNDVIQVRIRKGNKEEQIIKVFDNYNLLKDFILLDSSTFKIVLGSEGDISETCEIFVVKF